jgi:chromosome segregation ATPase
MNNSSLISLSHPQVDFEDDYITPFIRKLEDQRMVFSDNLRDVQRITKAFREKLTEYEENHGQAIRKLKIQEPRLGHLEFEIEEHRKELKRIDKKNRSLADNQRQLELDKRELERELQQTESQLKQNENHAKNLTNMTEKQRAKLEADAKKKLSDMRKNAAAEMKVREEKLERLREVMRDYNSNKGSRPGSKQATPSRDALI